MPNTESTVLDAVHRKQGECLGLLNSPKRVVGPAQNPHVPNMFVTENSYEIITPALRRVFCLRMFQFAITYHLAVPPSISEYCCSRQLAGGSWSSASCIQQGVGPRDIWECIAPFGTCLYIYIVILFMCISIYIYIYIHGISQVAWSRWS